jgi:hypothetical protein
MSSNGKKVSDIIERTKARQAETLDRQPQKVMEVVVTLLDNNSVSVARPECPDLQHFAAILELMGQGLIITCQAMSNIDHMHEGYAHEITNLAATIKRLCHKQAGVELRAIVPVKTMPPGI